MIAAAPPEGKPQNHRPQDARHPWYTGAMKTRSPYLVLAALAVLLGTGALAADERDYRQALLEVGTDIRLMCLAAHPDDEDGATLARYRKRFGVGLSP